MTEVFSLRRVNMLRRRALKAAAFPRKGLPDGWRRSPVSPMQLLSVFRWLKLEPGFELRAYHYHSRGNANSVVYAMPADSPIPPPEECVRDHGKFLEPPVPPGGVAARSVIRASGSCWSYMQGSLFFRELMEFGARWHGCWWTSHVVIGARPEGSRWAWVQPEPPCWLPEATVEADCATVTFFTVTRLEREKCVRHRDRYEHGMLVAMDRDEMATGGPGYVYQRLL